MSTTTTNLGMVLPSDGDSADIQVVNAALQKVDAWAEYDRESANNVYPGRNIANIPEFASAISSAGSVYAFLHARASAGNFAGLRVGDYIEVNCGVYGTRRFQIAHFDPWYQFGDTAMGHHICFVDSEPVALPSSDSYVTNGSYILWNTTATNQGNSTENCPYLISNLHAWEINKFLPALPTALQNVLIERREWLETRYSSSGGLTASMGAAWKSLGKVWSFSEIEVYGEVVWGTPGYTVATGRQLDYFRNIKNQLNGSRVNWWLRSVSGSSSSYVCGVANHGIADNTSATGTWVRPRCGFLLG